MGLIFAFVGVTFRWGMLLIDLLRLVVVSLFQCMLLLLLLFLLLFLGTIVVDTTLAFLRVGRTTAGAGPGWLTMLPRSSTISCTSTSSVRPTDNDKQLSAASYNFASAATRGLLPRSKEESTQKKLDAVWGVVQQIVEVSS